MSSSSTNSTPLATPPSSSTSSPPFTPSPTSGSFGTLPSQSSSPASSRSSSSLSSSSYTDSDAEAEWQESLRQLELLFSLVVIPFFGKWVGRKCAYWVWARFMTWKHPELDVVVTSRRRFEAVGAAEAASSAVVGAKAPL